MGFLAPPALLLVGGVLNVGGAALGGPPLEDPNTLGVELVRIGGVLAGFKPPMGGPPIMGGVLDIGGAAAEPDEGLGVAALGGGGGVAAAGFVSF